MSSIWIPYEFHILEVLWSGCHWLPASPGFCLCPERRVSHGLAASWNQHMVLQRHLVWHGSRWLKDLKDTAERRKKRTQKSQKGRKLLNCERWNEVHWHWNIWEVGETSHWLISVAQHKIDSCRSIHFTESIESIERDSLLRCSRDSLHWSPELKLEVKQTLHRCTCLRNEMHHFAPGTKQWCGKKRATGRQMHLTVLILHLLYDGDFEPSWSKPNFL